MERNTPQRVLLDISWEALFKLLAFAVGLWLVNRLADVLLVILGVFLFIAMVNPTIRRWQSHMSRFLAVLLLYLVILVVIVLIFSALLPTLVHQVNELARELPRISGRMQEYIAGHQRNSVQYSRLLQQAQTSLQDSTQNLSKGAIEAVLSAASSIAAVVTGIVISFYLLLEESNVREFLHQVLPQHRFEPAYRTVSKISERMGSWVRGQVLLMLIIGTSNLIAFILLGLPTPLPLALWAGLCELIPFFGPYIGMVPAVIVALTTGSPLQALLVFIVSFFVIQQIEAHIVVPKVMGRAVGLSPALVILALLTGFKLLGVWGALISVPIAAIISVIVGEWSQLRLIWKTEDETK